MTRRRQRPVLGLAISESAVRCVLLAAGRIVWHEERAICVDEPLELAARELLHRAPRAGWRRLGVAVGVGPSHAQLRRLLDLPAVRGARVLASIVQEGAGRYFLQNGVPLITTTVGPALDGGRWAGAIEAPVVATVVDTCRAEGMRLVRVAPTAALLGQAAPGGRFTWVDGTMMLRLEYDGCSLTSCRRLPASQETSADRVPPVLHETLASLGADALRFADAFAAARGAERAGLEVAPERIGAGEPSTARMALAGSACVAALLLALASPALSAMRQERAATARLQAMHVTPATIAAEAAAIDSAAVLGELAAFRRGTPSTILLLAALTDALEAPTMLVSLRLDESSGTLTALTPSTATLLEMLAAVRGITTPTIVGAVTSEAPPAMMPPTAMPMPMPMATSMPGAAGTQPPAPATERLERVTIRFGWEGAHGSAHLRAPRASTP